MKSRKKNTTKHNLNNNYGIEFRCMQDNVYFGYLYSQFALLMYVLRLIQRLFADKRVVTCYGHFVRRSGLKSPTTDATDATDAAMNQVTRSDRKLMVRPDVIIVGWFGFLFLCS